MAIKQRRISYFPFALLASIVVGLVLGSAFPERVHAANYWQFWAHIPVGSGFGQTVYLNCGWHGDCDDTPTSGIALDWEETNAYAYFAGAAWWDNWYVTNAAWVGVTNQPNYNGSLCKNTVAVMRNWYTGSVIGREIYTHVERSGYLEITVYAYSTPWGVRQAAGNVVGQGQDLTNCPHGGTHVHNYGTNWDATNTSGFPTYSGCSTPACLSYDNGTWVHWEDWTY